VKTVTIESKAVEISQSGGVLKVELVSRHTKEPSFFRFEIVLVGFKEESNGQGKQRELVKVFGSLVAASCYNLIRIQVDSEEKV
jgi:hypothetical protein